MSDVGLRHQQIVVTYPRDAAAARGTAVDRDKFAYIVALSDLRSRGLTGVLEVLRAQADGYERINVGLIPDRRVAINDNVRIKTNAGAEDHVLADGAESTDDATVADDRSLRHDRR
jgi:hypothetical protein